MTPIAPHITAFLRQHLMEERNVSGNTCESYAYAFKLLLEYAGSRLKMQPSKLCFEQIDAPLVVDFLSHLESHRNNVRTPGTSVWQRSSRSCVSCNIGCLLRWLKFSAC